MRAPFPGEPPRKSLRGASAPAAGETRVTVATYGSRAIRNLSPIRRAMAAPPQLGREAWGMKDAAGEMDGMHGVGFVEHDPVAGHREGGPYQERAPFLRRRRGNDRHGAERGGRTARAVWALAWLVRRSWHHRGMLLLAGHHVRVLVQARGHIVAATGTGNGRRAAQHGQDGQRPPSQPNQSPCHCGDHSSEITSQRQSAPCVPAPHHAREAALSALSPKETSRDNGPMQQKSCVFHALLPAAGVASAGAGTIVAAARCFAVARRPSQTSCMRFVSGATMNRAWYSEWTSRES
jgi:hypothetical protein